LVMGFLKIGSHKLFAQAGLMLEPLWRVIWHFLKKVYISSLHCYQKNAIDSYLGSCVRQEKNSSKMKKM
jgi:hypothetical protein